MGSIYIPITAVTEAQLSAVISELYLGGGEIGDDFDFQLEKFIERLPSVHIEGHLPADTSPEKFYATSADDFSLSVRDVTATGLHLELKGSPESRSRNVAHAHVTAFKLPTTYYLNLGPDLLSAANEIYASDRGLFEIVAGEIYAFYDTSYGRPSE